MFKTKKPTLVSKVGVAHIPEIKGQDLLKLHDTKSEFSKNIQTYNTAVNAAMKRYLSRSLRDANTNIEGLNRSQQAVYKTMCKIMEIQKHRSEEMSLKYRSGVKKSNDSRSSSDGSLVSPKAMPVVTRTKMVKNLSPIPQCKVKMKEESTKATLDRDPETTPPPIQVKITSKNKKTNETNDQTPKPLSPVIEGGKSQQAESMDKSDTISTFVTSEEVKIPISTGEPHRVSIKKAHFTATLRSSLPPIVEVVDPGLNASQRALNRIKGRDVTVENKQHYYLQTMNDETSSYDTKSDTSTTVTEQPSNPTAQSGVDEEPPAKKALSLRARIAQLEQEHIKEFLRKQNLETKPKPYQLPVRQHFKGTTVETQKANTSVVAERRKLAKLRELYRKAVLNSENSYLYSQLPDGSFVAGAKAYKRKNFLPPSNKELIERERLLRSIEVEVGLRGEKIGDFFKQLNLPLERKPEPKRPEVKVQAPAKSPTSNRQTIKRENPSIPKPLIETVKDIAYVRQYIRPADRDKYTPKITSWRQRY